MITTEKRLRTLMEVGSVMSGRTRLTTMLDRNASFEAIREDIRRVEGDATRNMAEAKWLWEYVKNNQPILDRADSTDGASSNNKVVVNYAVAISRNLSAYTFPTGINYLSRREDDESRAFVDELNRKMTLASNNVATQEMKWHQSVCGAAYMYANYNADDDKNAEDYVPFKIQTLEPWSTAVVYSAYNRYNAVYAFSRFSDDLMLVFTPKKIYTITTDTAGNEVAEERDHIFGIVPVVEIPNNTMRMGDFETVLSLLNATNNVASDSVNNVEDIVKSYLVLLGVDPNDVEKLDFSAGKVIALGAQPGTNQSAQFIHPALDGTTVQQLRSYMDSAMKFITGVPDRDTENNSSSTGVSEDIKTGQADKDAVANEKTLYVEDAQRKLLKIILEVLRTHEPENVPANLTPADIDIDITRANRDNILTKSQAMMNLSQIGFSDEDVVYFGNITNDVPGVVARMKKVADSDTNADDMIYG